MEKTKLPAFKGKSLIEIPAEVPQAGFLEGDFGKAFLEEYNGRVKTDYNQAKSLNVLRYDNGVVKGSNPFAVVLANQILKQEGLRTASQADLEQILKTNVMDLTGTYEDTSLVLRTEGDPNKYLAKNLAQQVKARGEKVGKIPIIIPLNTLRIVNYSNLPRGLAFYLTDKSEVIYAPVLKGENNRKNFSETNKYGLPKKLGKGNRTLYTRNSGLSGVGLGRNLGMYSDVEDLGDSDGDGRVVVVSAGGTLPENLSRYISQLQEERNTQVAEVDRRYQEALKVLKRKK